MKLAQPPGVRSCRDGAERWVTPEAADSRAVREAVQSLPPAVRADFRAQVLEKRNQALAGQLSFCTCGPADRGCPHDVKQMLRREQVLELRWKNVVDDEGRELQARLYFTEPENPDVLVFLAFRPKYPADAGWREQQNQHIDEAEAVRVAYFGP